MNIFKNRLFRVSLGASADEISAKRAEILIAITPSSTIASQIVPECDEIEYDPAVISDEIEYDSAVIQEYARAMYQNATWYEVGYTIMGIVAGIILGLLAGASSENGGMFAFFGAMIAGVIGYSIGRSKAFWLRLQAQLALCQVEIEKGVRK